MANIWHEIKELIKLEDHSDRHENGGADEISIKGLSGEPQIIDDMMTYYETVVTHEGKILTRST